MVRIYRNDEWKEKGGYRGSFEILRDGIRIYKQTGWDFSIGDWTYDPVKSQENGAIAMGRDITGDGKPDLVISEWTGGMHCCYPSHIFEIGEEFRKIASLDAQHGEVHFANLDGKPGLEATLPDWTFAYWKTSFAESPAPEVILRFQGGKYRMAGDLMKKPPPDSAVLERKVRKVLGDERWKEREVASSLWGVMLDLIYSGNAEVAWKFFDRAWPPEIKGKEQFLADFRSQLSQSPYWPEIKSLNNL